MEREKDVLVEDKSNSNTEVDRGGSVLRSNLFLDTVGEVVLTLNSDGLSWKSVDSVDNELGGSNCFGIKLASRIQTEIKISDVYSVEYMNWGVIHESVFPDPGGRLLGRDSEMHRFAVHGFQKSKTQQSVWNLAVYIFGHKDLQTCQSWVKQINDTIRMEVDRPKNLLVFVHPFSGKGNGCRIWETVAPIFSRAKVSTKVIVTQRAGHAFGIMKSITDEELKSYDGVVSVGGDGFFNEILNGLLSSRHRAPYPPAPTDIEHSGVSSGSHLIYDPNIVSPETSHQKEEQDPLLPCSGISNSGFSSFGTEGGSCNTERNSVVLPNRQFRLGIIPAGSTDAIVICTTGTRDPVTSALHIVLGKRVSLDIAQIVRWKTTSSSKDSPSVRYAASFAGYGFYGDVIAESEKYRWMGPNRYDYAGTMVFLKHRSYEAEVAYLEVKMEKVNSSSEKGPSGSGTQSLWGAPRKPERAICCANCSICSTNLSHMYTKNPIATPYLHPEKSRWLHCKGRFLSIGAAIISCRNERAPDGLVADAHLADGFLHLILIKDCPRALYLWHLTEIARKGGKPLNFDFVEHHKTTAFTFTSHGDESVWNLDGEVFQAHQLSAQVFRGLVSLFAFGPEV